MNYLLGSGYHATPGSGQAEFASLWQANVKRFARPAPAKVVIISVGHSVYPVPRDSELLETVIDLDGNLGHVGDLLNGAKQHELCGWSAAVLTLAMLAYTAELDLMVLEQDCLAFGPWVEQTYQDLGDGQVVFGSCKLMGVAQSLFLVRHAYLPKFVSLYLGLGTDNNWQMLPEHKFHTLERLYPEEWRRLSFPFDRDRPLDYELPVWYAQKFTAEELDELKARGLI